MIKNGTYRHFKGNVYEVTGTAVHTETGEELVLYCAAEDTTKTWARPATMWAEEVQDPETGESVPRFQPFNPWEDRKARTMAALRDPQVGDCFQEHLSFWVYVVYRAGPEVWYCEANPPCRFPKDAKLTKTTVQRFYDRFVSPGHALPPSSWVMLEGRDNVTGWADAQYREVTDERGTDAV